MDEPHPRQIPALYQRSTAILKGTRGQAVLYQRLVRRSGKHAHFNVQLLEAVDLLFFMVQSFNDGAIWRVRNGNRITEINPHPVCSRHIIDPIFQRSMPLAPSTVSKLFDMAWYFNLTNLDDMLCTVWDNYLCVGRLLLPRDHTPRGTLTYQVGKDVKLIELERL